MHEARIYRSDRSNNPALDEVFEACMNCYHPTDPAVISFWLQLGIGQRIGVRVKSVGHESGRIGALLLEGTLVKPVLDGHSEFSASYDAREGIGYMRLYRFGEPRQT